MSSWFPDTCCQSGYPRVFTAPRCALEFDLENEVWFFTSGTSACSVHTGMTAGEVRQTWDDRRSYCEYLPWYYDENRMLHYVGEPPAESE